MDTPRRISLLTFERVSEELARVLVDARCSFVARDGRYYLATSGEPSGRSPEAARFATMVVAQPGPQSSTTTIDLRAGRVPGATAELTNPIALLHWVLVQPAAADFHPTVSAYLGSSDPDDILPYLPFHPAPGEGGEATSIVVAVRVTQRSTDTGAEGRGVFRIAGLDLQPPGEALGT